MGTTTDTHVLTLAEAAAFLRVPEDVVLRMAEVEGLPARKVGDEWRFLKEVIEHWLGQNSPKALLLMQAGALKNDPYFDEMLTKIYQERERQRDEGV